MLHLQSILLRLIWKKRFQVNKRNLMAVENGAYLLIIPTVILIALLAVAALVLAIRQSRA